MNMKISNSKPVLFSEESVAGLGIGVIELNRPEALNALNTECYELLEPKLIKWQKDTHIAAVIIKAKPGRAFCAGGDVKALVTHLNSTGISAAKDFFTREYFVDYLIHSFKKPVLAFADGITFGGGIGLINGASHRIVTENTIMAMPELAIGLFPDVGATSFLGKLKNNFGVFMGLTGARIKAQDLVHIGLADFFVPTQHLRKIHADIIRMNWSSSPDQNKMHLSQYLNHNFKLPPPSEDLGFYVDNVSQIFAETNYEKLKQKFINFESNNAFIKECQKRFMEGSTLAKQVFFMALEQHKNLTIKETLIEEWGMAIQFSKHREFREGVRALLIDKDNSPKWTYSEEQPIAEVAQFFSLKEDNLLALKLRDFT